MKRRRILMIVAGVFVAAVLVVVLWPREKEPEYQGKTMTVWTDDWAARRTGPCHDAWKHIGTNALPYAVRNLALNDSKWRSNYARVQAKMPNLLQRAFRRPKPLLKEVDGANVFFSIGSNSVPYAVALLKHDSPTVRRSAAWGLGTLRRQCPAAAQAIPALAEALNDEDRMVRFYAASSLKEMGPDATLAVPALARVVAFAGSGPETNNMFYVRAVAASALGKIGPSATNALPVLQGSLHESLPYLRGACAVAIWRISGDADATLPVILDAMPVTEEGSKWDWIIALGEMGPRAQAAVPQLKQELERDQLDWVRNYITNALGRVDQQMTAPGVLTNGVSGQ